MSDILKEYPSFPDSIVKYNAENELSTSKITLLKDDFDDETLNTVWTTNLTGVATIAEDNHKITLDRQAADTCQLFYMRYYGMFDTWDFQYDFEYVNVTDTNTGSFFVIEDGQGPQTLFYGFMDATGNIYILCYFQVGGWHYWKGSTDTWETTTEVAYAGAVGTKYKVRITFNGTTHNIRLYDSTGSLLENAEIADSSVANHAGRWLQFSIGDYISGGTGKFNLEISDMVGLYADNMTGVVTNILTQDQLPTIKGEYTEDVTNNVYDETYDRSNYSTGATPLRELRETNNQTKLSQGFKLDIPARIKKTRLYLIKNGTPTGNVWVEIWSDDGAGKPLAQLTGFISNVIDCSTITNTGATKYIDFAFNTVEFLNQETQYHLVFNGDYTISATHNIAWGYDATGAYADGIPCRYDNGAGSWDSATFVGNDFIFGIQFYKSSQFVRRIAYSKWAAYKTLTTKADWEGYSQATDGNIDTATEPGKVLLVNTPPYVASGWIRNDIDLGAVPTEFCTISVIGRTETDTTITVDVASSDDGAAWSGYSTITITNGSGDLTAMGKHRYWRVRVTLATADTAVSPELHAWTIDAFKPLQSLNPRDRLQKYIYAKVQMAIGTTDPENSIILNSYELAYRIAYELYIKKAKYSVSSSGILLSMDLSSI